MRGPRVLATEAMLSQCSCDAVRAIVSNALVEAQADSPEAGRRRREHTCELLGANVVDFIPTKVKALQDRVVEEGLGEDFHPLRVDGVVVKPDAAKARMPLFNPRLILVTPVDLSQFPPRSSSKSLEALRMAVAILAA